MRHKTRTVFKNTDFVISRRTNAKGRVYYELSINSDGSVYWDPIRFTQVRDIIDPTRNRSGHFGKSWKYPNREAAEKDLVMLTMLIG